MLHLVCFWALRLFQGKSIPTNCFKLRPTKLGKMVFTFRRWEGLRHSNRSPLSLSHSLSLSLSSFSPTCAFTRTLSHTPTRSHFTHSDRALKFFSCKTRQPLMRPLTLKTEGTALTWRTQTKVRGDACRSVKKCAQTREREKMDSKFS